MHASTDTYETQSGNSGGLYLAVGDFDSNGTPDLIVAHGSGRVGLLLNTSIRPRVLQSQFDYLTGPQTLVFNFDQDISASLSANDITVERRGAGTIFPDILSFRFGSNVLKAS